jgi:hypothetical protein
MDEKKKSQKLKVFSRIFEKTVVHDEKKPSHTILIDYEVFQLFSLYVFQV